MAAVTVAHSVNKIATQSHQLPVLFINVQIERCNVEPSLYSCVVSLVIVVMGSDVSRIVHHSRDNDRSECGDDSRGFPGVL